MKRVVITGIGLVAPNGVNKEQFWQNCAQGLSFIEKDNAMSDAGLKSNVLCRIKNFDLKDHLNLSEYPELPQLDKFIQYGVVAGETALKDAKLETMPEQFADYTGAIFSSAIGGTPTIVDIFSELTNQGSKKIEYKPVGDRFYNSGMFNYPVMLLAKKYGFSAPCTSVSTGCTAGLDALGMSYYLIQSGEANIMLAGASEAPLTMLTYATLDVINAMSTTDCSPEKSSRPFDALRSGFVISEGAAVLVLEELEHALQRNAHIYAEIKSYASVSNSFHMTDLPADGIPMARVIHNAMQASGLKLQEIDYINAHGSSTPQNDLFETAAYKTIFQQHIKNIPISSTKSMIGHSLSSASLMGVVSILGAIKNEIIHPTINYEVADEQCDLDYVPNVARRKKVNAGLVTASGFGGIHSAAVLQRYANV